MSLVIDSGWTEGDRYYSNVSLLLHGDGANGSTTITDSSPTPKTVTAVGATISTTQSKYGGSSINFTSANARVEIENNSSLDLASTIYTVEFFIYPDYSGAYPGFANVMGKQQETIAGWSIWLVNGVLNVGINGNYNSIAAALLAKQSWTHIAVVDTGTQTVVYVNGAQSATSASRNTTSTSLLFTAGCNKPGVNWGAVYPFSGYIDDLRITKGVARYTANFTPPTEPFADGYY